MEQLLLPMPVQASEHESMESAQAQSVALVQIFLNASLACICYARELLDWRSPCFKKRRIGDISLECSPDEIYNAFVSLDCVEEETSQEIRVLVRSQNHRANRILDMIEYGIFDAIEQGYVDTLQVFITNDAQHNKSILEAYTYCFRYQGARVTGVDLRASDDTFTLEDCQKSFKLAFRGLLRSVQSLPPLPGRFALGMSVAYTDQCPPRYEPAGFVANSLHSIDPKQWDNLWKPSKNHIVTFDTAHHTLKIAARDFCGAEQTTSQVQDAVMSKQLETMQKSSSGRNINATSTLPIPPPAKTHLPEPMRSSRKRKSAHEEAHTLPYKKQNTAAVTSETAPFQSGQAANPLRNISTDAKRRRKRLLLPEKIAEIVIHACGTNEYHQASGLVFDKAALQAGRLSRLVESEEVKCECGSTHVAEDMLYCALCGAHQHAVCYALTDVCRPVQHLCYNCLVLPTENDLLSRLQMAVYMRLALKHIASRENATLRVGELFEHAVVGDQKRRKVRTKDVLHMLYKKKVLLQCRGDLATINPLQKAQLDEVKSEFLDPFVGIGHHYRPVRESDTAEKLKSSLNEALLAASGGRDYWHGDLEEITIRNSYEEDTTRYGYFPELEGLPSSETYRPSPRRRKLSISRTLIRFDRSSPDSVMSREELVVESLNGAERDTVYGSQVSSTATGY